MVSGLSSDRLAPARGHPACTGNCSRGRTSGFLTKGQITVEGPFYDKKNSAPAITGGTGAYAGARGRMELKSRAGGTKYDFVFHLLG